MIKKEVLKPISEINIIRFLLYNSGYRATVFSTLKKEMFKDSNCSDIFGIIGDYYNRYNKFPSSNIEIIILNNELKQDKKIIDEKISIVRCDTKEYDIDDIDSFLKETEIWWKNQRFSLMAMKCVAQYKEIDKKTINCDVIQTDIKDIQNFSFDSDDFLDWHNDGEMCSIYEDPDIRQKFYSRVLTQATGGGIPKKCLFVIMGASGAGKSRLLHSIACDHMRENKNNVVLYFSLEMTKKDMATRTDANFFNIPIYQIKEMYHTNKENWIKKRDIFKNKYGKMIVDDRSDHSPATIRAKIDSLIQKDLKPTMIIVDYIGLVKSNISDQSNMYLNGSIVAKSLLSMSKDFEIPILTAVQPTREGGKNMMNGKKSGQGDVGESKAIYDDSDVFVTVNMTEEEEENQRQRISIIKNRHYNKKETIIGELHKEIWKVDFLDFNSVNETQQTSDKINNGENITEKEILSQFDNVGLPF